SLHFAGARSGSTYLAWQGRGNDQRRRVAEQIRDHVVKSAAWKVLADRRPDRDFCVKENGEVFMRPESQRHRETAQQDGAYSAHEPSSRQISALIKSHDRGRAFRHNYLVAQPSVS